ncbi:MAG: TonB-dependent receptor [Balneola sp.]|nr:MAG: TonB-dependent receptor [Balneola sp.]
MKKILKSAFILIFGLICFDAYAQSGKIQGKLIDADTKEPLIGATVGIQGTTKGAITDIDGNYLMLNVAPGTYIIEARYIGYATVVVQEVIVRTDLTTTQDFELAPESFEGEELVVVAERQTVIKDITSSEARVSSDEIEKLPVQEVTDVIQLQAGVNVGNDGGIHIRGGRTSEVSYVVDGIRVTDDYDGSNGIRLENESIQELQVISGSFNAEHGQALSGVVNVVTKSGGNKYDASVRAWSGGYLATNKPELYDGIGTSLDSFNPLRMYNFSASVSGPIIKDKLTFFATTRSFLNEGYLTGRNLYSSHGKYVDRVPLDTDLDTYRTLYNERVDLNLPWYSIDTVTVEGVDLLEIRDDGTRDSSLVDMTKFETLSFQGNLEYKFSNTLKFNLIGSIATEESGGYGYNSRFVPTGQNNNFRDNYSINFKTTITPSAYTFLTVNIANRYNEFNSYLYEDPWDPRYFNYDNLSDPLFGTPNILYGNQIPNAGQFATYGTNNSRFFRSTNSYIAKAELSSQLNNHHFIKAGVSAQFDEIKFESVSLIPLIDEGVNFPEGTPDELRVVCADVDNQYPCLELGFPEVNTPGYQKYSENPINLSAYIQDKIEYDNLIINVGLRFDYFDPNTEIPADPEDPDIFFPTKTENQYTDLNGNGQQDDNEPSLTVEDRAQYWWKDASVKYQLSPRIGVAYPINDGGVIYFSYGYFFQMPSYERLYTNSQIFLTQGGGDQGLFGNPDLKPERSIQYELGLKQEIFEGTAIEWTGYYKDTRDYVSSRPQVTGSESINYGIYFNRDYSKSLGMTFAFNQFVSSRFNFGLDYTFGVVEGSNSDPNAEYFNIRGQGGVIDSTSQEVSLTKIVQPLDWDRTHILNGSMFYTGNNWGANLLARFNSGTPYTPATNIPGVTVGEVASNRNLRNTARLPSRFTIDLNAYKNFQIGNNTMQVFLNVYNLLDTKIVNGVYADSGLPTRPLPASIIEDAHPDFYNDPTFYAEPRRVQFGLQLSF